MKGLLLSGPSDYFALGDRRRWWIIATTCVLGLVALLVAVSLPSIYESETLILVQPQEVPTSVVQNFVAWNTQQRLISIQEQVLSRTNMLRIIKSFPDGFDELRPLNEGAQVEVLRSRVTIDVAADHRSREVFVPFFRISYQDRDPALAQKVTAQLADSFIFEDAKTREEQVVQTARFLEDEAAKVAMQLKQAEDELAELKRRFGSQLPEQLNTNLRALDRLQQQLSANNEQRDRLLTLKLDLQRRLSETDPIITREVKRGMAGGVPRRERTPQVEAYRQNELVLQQLLSRYTEQHPDIQRLRAELKALEKEIPPEELLEIQDPLPVDAAVESEPNPVYQQLTSQLLQVNNEVKIADEQRDSVEASVAEITRRVMNTPEVEQQVLVVQRRYLSLKAEFDTLKSRQQEADLARSLETNQKGEQFSVLDHANYPYTPSKPNRLLVLAIGLAIAFGVGCLVAVAVDLTDQRIYTYAEVEKLLGAPVLAEIPEILTEPEKKHIRRHGWLKAAAMVAMVGVGLAAIYAVYTIPALRSEGSEFMARLLRW